MAKERKKYRGRDATPGSNPNQTPLQTGTRGLVVISRSQHHDIETEDGRLISCTGRQRVGSVVCGDQVIWQEQADGTGVIVEVLPRRNLLERPDAYGRIKPVAANIDQMIVVDQPHVAETSATRAIDTYILDRYLVAAAITHASAILVINKEDQTPNCDAAAVTAVLDYYRQMGFTVLRTSCRTGAGIADLNRALVNHTSICVGQSGVGKSSLISQLHPDADVRIGAVAENTGLGRHTTSTTTLFHLPNGGHLIDSPGVREFGLSHAVAADVVRAYPDIGRIAQRCRFLDCHHDKEPGCHVQTAVATGELPAWRYDNFKRIVASQTQTR